MARKRWNARFALQHLELPLKLRGELEAQEAARTRSEERRAERAKEKQKAALLRDNRTQAHQWPSFSEPPGDGRRYLLAWSPEQVRQHEGSAPSRLSDRDELTRAKKVITQMRESGPWRRLVGLPDDWRARINELLEQFPNFGEALGYIATSCALAARRDGIVRLGPMLLSGPPGIGKTLFCDALAEAFALPMHRVDMAAAQSGSRLAGSEEFWANSKPGLLFDLLALGVGDSAANSMVLLDELEKVAADRQYDPMGPMYSLLEPASARTFADHSFPMITLDASRLVFIATANNPERIPTPILSRMRQFRVQAPRLDQARAIIHRIHTEVAGELAIGVEPLTDAVVDRLIRYAPRTVRQQLLEAFGRALVAGRTVLDVSDVPAAPVVVKPAARHPAVIFVVTTTEDSGYMAEERRSKLH